MSKSCSTLPYSLVLLEGENYVVGYCRLAKVINDVKSVLVESGNSCRYCHECDDQVKGRKNGEDDCESHIHYRSVC